MRKANYSLLIGACAVPLLAACGGTVDLAKASGDDGGQTQQGQHEGGPEDAEPADAQQGVEPKEAGDELDDAGPEDAELDGPGDFVSGATGAAPACNLAPLACGSAFPGEGSFATAQDAANVLVGQWSFCGAGTDVVPAGQLGEEFAADGTYYELVAGPTGLVRNLNPETMGSWQVALDSNGGIAVYTDGGGWQRRGGLSACPASLVLGSVMDAVESRILPETTSADAAGQ